MLSDSCRVSRHFRFCLIGPSHVNNIRLHPEILTVSRIGTNCKLLKNPTVSVNPPAKEPGRPGSFAF